MESRLTSRLKKCWKKLKFTMSPSIRLRKLQRNTNMRKMRMMISGLVIFICFITALFYYWNRSTGQNQQYFRYTKPLLITTERATTTTVPRYGNIRPIVAIITGEEKVNISTNVDMFNPAKYYLVKIVDTGGCKIPKTMVNYVKFIQNDKKKRVKCGKRGVFLRKLDDNTVVATIKNDVINKYLKHKDGFFDCCYQFILKTMPFVKSDHQKLVFSNCTRFEHNSKISLETDFITVKCTEYTDTNVSHRGAQIAPDQILAKNIIYNDMYAFVKKIKKTEPDLSRCDMKFNVLMIGMDSMSLPRAGQTLPKTVTLFQNEYWNGFRGYHKIADNTFPNLIAAFTGKNLTTIEQECSGNMDRCNNLMIWSKFKEAGYVTAYGEDYLQLPDTFTNEYKFNRPPTDHYMRPFFLNGEYKRPNSTFLCAGKICSGKQILDYALEFAFTYKNDPFFGLFWINSFSHDAKSRPHEADTMFENFFNQLTSIGIMSNTFIIFFSDHGIRFGGQRFKMEAYYDDRLPMFFMWIPIAFKKRHPFQVTSLMVNQFRLITPYDIYSTLLHIRQLSLCSKSMDSPPEGCSKCHSTFKTINTYRTCSDVAISDKWCSCHKMYPLSLQDPEGKKTVDLVVKYISSLVKTIQTEQCWGCMSLSLKTILRIHYYYGNDIANLYYVVAFSMSPGNTSYEATVFYASNEPGTVLGPVSVISNYRGLGRCVINRRDRLFCVCQKVENC